MRKYLLIVVTLVLCLPLVAAQESASFRMDRLTVAGGAGSSSSTSFAMTVLAASEGPVGSSSFCNAGFVNTLGFWSVLGNAQVPVRLQVGLVPETPADVDLAWTGAADTFEVYRADLPEDVLNSNNLLEETAVCEAEDSLASSADLLFYKVIPKP